MTITIIRILKNVYNMINMFFVAEPREQARLPYTNFGSV